MEALTRFAGTDVPEARGARALMGWLAGGSLARAGGEQGLAPYAVALWRDGMTGDWEGFIAGRLAKSGRDRRPSPPAEAMGALAERCRYTGPGGVAARAVMAWLNGATLSAAAGREGACASLARGWRDGFLNDWRLFIARTDPETVFLNMGRWIPVRPNPPPEAMKALRSRASEDGPGGDRARAVLGWLGGGPVWPDGYEEGVAAAYHWKDLFLEDWRLFIERTAPDAEPPQPPWPPPPPPRP
jgi:hypothetical protein